MVGPETIAKILMLATVAKILNNDDTKILNVGNYDDSYNTRW